MFSAVLDTCVLYGSLERDFLLSMAVEGLYRPLWSDVILEELLECEFEKWAVRVPADEARRRADRLISELRREFEDSLVGGWERASLNYGLPDPDDEHVVAVAHFSGAGAVVTRNTKHFPRPLIPAHIDVLHPSEFARLTVEVNPRAAALAVVAMSNRRGITGPAMSPDGVLDDIAAKLGLRSVADAIRPHLHE